MTIIKYVVALGLLFHGGGHALGFLAAWTKLPMGFLDNPWVFVLVGQEWWIAAALWSSVISIVAIVPWWNTVTPSARMWPLIVDVLVLAALLGPWRDRITSIVG